MTQQQIDKIIMDWEGSEADLLDYLEDIEEESWQEEIELNAAEWVRDNLPDNKL